MNRSTHDRLRDRMNDISRPLKRSYRSDEIGDLISRLTSSILQIVAEEIDAKDREIAELKRGRR
jgi:hypothetical protein